MVFEWKNKVLLITGASNGIGAEVIRQSLAEGVQQVYNLDIDVENGVALQNELNKKYGDEKIKFIECDVTSEEQLRTNFELVLGDKHKQFVVINNAGIFNESLKTFRKEIEINLTAAVTGSLLALDLMRKDNGGNGGTIINISSIAAIHPDPCAPIYNATKSGVLTFSTCLGADEYYKRTEIRVLTICFGCTETNILLEKNMGSFDKETGAKFMEVIKSNPNQSVESAGRALIDVFKYGNSASVWLSSADKPAEDITDYITRAYKIMSEPLFK